MQVAKGVSQVLTYDLFAVNPNPIRVHPPIELKLNTYFAVDLVDLLGRVPQK